jgi:hypothetical protein
MEAERAGLLLKGHNSQDTGDERERILSRMIRSWFPSTHTIFRGQLVSIVDLQVTRPIDLGVANTAKWCPLVEVGSAVQILAGSVGAAIEVKSTITNKSEFKNAVEKLSQASHQVKAKDQRRDRWPPTYLSCLFAYRGPKDPAMIVKWLPSIARAPNGLNHH